MKGFHYKIQIHLRFSDIDALGHVNNAVNLTYFEIARSAYWTDVIAWDWKQSGIIIRKSVVDYHKPIILGDEVYAYVRTSKIGNSSFELDYILVKSGQTICVSIDYQSQKPTKIPQLQRQRMEESMFDNLE